MRSPDLLFGSVRRSLFPPIDGRKLRFRGGWTALPISLVMTLIHPASLSLADLRALPQRTQITRHDCVEGWSAIGQWRGARLRALLERVHPMPSAKFVVFKCADSREDGGPRYSASIDMEDGNTEQQILGTN